MPNSTRNDIEFAPSQYIAAFLSTHGIDGLKYESINDQMTKSYNVVLFNPENAKCIDEFGEVFRCINTQMTFQNISSFVENTIKTESTSPIANEDSIIEDYFAIKNYKQFNIASNLEL